MVCLFRKCISLGFSHKILRFTVKYITRQIYVLLKCMPFDVIVMLTPSEQNYVKELLELLSTDDLIRMGLSATKSAVEIKSREDAIKAIVLHEASCSSLLRRKKITKALLFKYLHSKEIAFDGSLDKEEISCIILKYWEYLTSKVNSTVQEAGKAQIEYNVDNKIEANSTNLENALAHQFCSWFYGLWNEDFKKNGGPFLSEKDFWSECQTSILLPETADSGPQEFSASSAEESVNLLRGLISQYDLYFSPNLSLNGVSAKSDPHGLVIVSACGTLHARSGNCVGIFEQIFGLISDPMSENNYKMKRVNLRIQRSPKAGTPAIMGSTL